MANKTRILITVVDGKVRSVYTSDPSVIDVIIRDHGVGDQKDFLFEGEDGNRYCEFDADISPWSQLKTQPFEQPVFIVGTSVLVPDPVIGSDDAWAHGFEGTIVRLWSDVERGEIRMATVRDSDDDCFDVEVDRLTHS